MKRILAFCFLAMTALLPQVSAQAPAPDGSNFYAINLVGFFPGETRGGVPKAMNLYLARRDGVWAAGLGTATVDGRAVWNTAIMPVDLSGLQLVNARLQGEVLVTLVPDPWVPKDGIARVAKVTLDVGFEAPKSNLEIASMKGTWSSVIAGGEEELTAARLTATGTGTVTGGLGGIGPHDVSDASFDFLLYNLIPGESKDSFQRRRAVSIGVRDGKPVSTRTAMVDMRHRPYDFVVQEAPLSGDFSKGDSFEAQVRFETDTLDGYPAVFTVALKGARVAGWVTGTWTARIVTPDLGPEVVERTGFFRGDVRKGAALATKVVDNRPWFAPVEGFKVPAPGEHPRLFFRKADVPELRRRAATPEGEIIIKRLREQLNGGDGRTLPASYNPATKAYDKKFKEVPGTYTISHAAGYGFLYQLTGDTLYADLARACVEKAWEGQRSGDDRYAWVAPGGELRAGPSIGWTAVAYDLCYDAWPEDFRLKTALALQNYNDSLGGEWNNPEGITLRAMVLQPRHGPGSNHFGAVLGGSGLAVLSILGDPGTDSELLQRYLAAILRNVPRHLSAGWGDGGYYKEGWGASRVGTQGGFLSLLQALRVSLGQDYLNVDRPNATNITMVPRALLVLGPRAFFPYRSNMGDTYGNAEIGSPGERNGMSKGGYFSEGFGAVAERHKPGLLWVYNRFFNATGSDPFDTMSPYPHRSMLALVNWPTFSGIGEANPAEALPLAVRDTLYDHFAFRNRFQDANDVVVTLLIQQPDGTKPRDVMVWGMGGLRLNFGEPPRNSSVTHYAPRPDGSAELTVRDYAFAVDFSGLSGTDVLVVSHAPEIKFDAAKAGEKARYQRVGAFNVLTLSATAEHPDAVATEEGLQVGKRAYRLNEQNQLLPLVLP